ERRQRQKWTMIALVGVTFGMYHLPVFRQPITALMGMALAWMAFESRSIWPGALMHFLNNALAFFGATLVNAFAEFWNKKSLLGVKLPQFDQSQPGAGEHMRDVPIAYLILA